MHREPYEEVQEAPEDAEEMSLVDAALEKAGFNAAAWRCCSSRASELTPGRADRVGQATSTQ